MKKVLFLIIVASFSICAMAQIENRRTTSPASYFTVSGTIEGAPDGTKVYLGDMQGFFSFFPSDSTVVKNGKYLFKGVQKRPVFRYIVAVLKGEGSRMNDFVLENTNITVNLAKDAKKNVVIGGRDNELWKEYNKLDELANKKIEPAWNIVQDKTKSKEERDAAQKKVNEFDKAQQERHIKFLMDHIPSGLSSLLLSSEYSRLDKPTLTKILALMKEKCPQDEVYRDIVGTAVGSQFTDIVMKSPEGDIVKISDFVGKNKLVLIDFWASWCGPCRQEMPNVIKAYNEYKDKGLAIVGVSLDNNKAAWVDAIKKIGIPWAQMSDLRGWQSEGAAAYNVKAIPATVLLDKSGKIIARGLRGDELAAKLKGLLK